MQKLAPILHGLDDPAAEKVYATWRRLLQSGLLRARGINDGIDAVHEHHKQSRAAANASLAANELHKCALAECTARKAHASHYKRCYACHTVCYCCKEHQVADWPSHTAACKAARKAAAAAGVSGK